MEAKHADLNKNRMNPTTGLRFLRPCLHNDLSAARKAAYIRWFSTSRSLLNSAAATHKTQNVSTVGTPPTVGAESRAQVQERIAELKDAGALEWPRIKSDKEAMRVGEYIEKYIPILGRGELREHTYVKVRGRVRSFRVAGKSLVFLDIAQDGKSVQIVLNRARLEGFGGISRKEFIEFYHLVRRGDIICELNL
jgi:lysyl-tRNA synthetase, class II